jgi:hypothetical protein
MTTIPDVFAKYCILPLHAHQPAPTNAIAVGNLDAIFRNLPDTNARSAALARADAVMSRIEDAEQEQDLTRATQIGIFADCVDALTRRLDAFEERLAEQARQDAEEAEREEQQQIQAELDALPDPDNPGPFHGGELSVIPASTPEDERQLAAIEGDDGEGDLPPELLKRTPPELGTDPIVSSKLHDPAKFGYPPDPPEVAQPISVSLNEDD